MTLMETSQLLGNFGEFAGAIAVVATLFYLVIQIRLNTRMIATEARQRVLDRFSDAKSNVIANPYALSAIDKAAEEEMAYDDLSKEEKSVLYPVISSFGDNLYNAIRLREEGILDEEAFEYIARSFCGFCTTRAGRAWWESVYADNAPETLRQFVEKRIG